MIEEKNQQMTNLPEQIQWLVNKLWVIPTVKFITPYHQYDCFKCQIGLQEFYDFVLQQSITKGVDITSRIKIRDKILNDVMQASILYTTQEDTEKLATIIDNALDII